MSAQAVKDSLADFGALAFDAIHSLQREVKELRAENERLEKELDLAIARAERAER